MSGSQQNSLIDSLEDASPHMHDSIKIDQLRYEKPGFGPAYPEDGSHTDFLDDFKNKSRYPEDFVSQFSPVEEEPVINQKVLGEFEFELNEHEKQLLNQQKHVFTTSSIITSSNKESANAHHVPAGHVVHSAIGAHKTAGAEFEPEEFTYKRTGPLLVGNPVILKPEPESLTEVNNKGQAGHQHEYDWSIPSAPNKQAPYDSSPVTAAAKAQASNIMQDFDPFFATAGGPGATAAKKPVAVSKPDDSINKTTSFLPGSSATTSKFTTSTSADKIFSLKRLNPKFLDLIYWRDPKKSALFFVPVFVLLLCLALFSFISVFAYAGLILIAISLSLRLYTIVLSYFGKKQPESAVRVGAGDEKLDEKIGAKNPLEPYLNTSLKLNEDVHRQVDGALKQWNNSVDKFRSLVLSENFLDTAKLAVVLWFLTYVGACISFMALIIIAFVALFTLPKFYEVYQQPIDHYYALAEAKVKHVLAVVNEKIAQITKKKPHVE